MGNDTATGDVVYDRTELHSESQIDKEWIKATVAAGKVDDIVEVEDYGKHGLWKVWREKYGQARPRLLCKWDLRYPLGRQGAIKRRRKDPASVDVEYVDGKSE